MTNELDVWSSEFAEFLTRDLGHANPRDGVSRLIPREAVPDAVDKLLLTDSRGERCAVALCSAPAAPNMVKRGIRMALRVKRRLGDKLGAVILDTLLEGERAGLSYAVLPYRNPLSDNRIGWWYQRRKLTRPLLQWLRELTAETMTEPGDTQILENFVLPLRRFIANSEVGSELREQADQVLRRIETGLWAPRHVLMHNDLWKGNLLSTSDEYGFAVIDWPGARVDGYGFFDLLKLGDSLGLSRRAFRNEMLAHCALHECSPRDAQSNIVMALAELHSRLEHFPLARFERLAAKSIQIAALIDSG